jgi:hypothetical protein
MPARRTLPMNWRLDGKRVWLIVDDERRRGTVVSADNVSVVIREDRGRGVIVMPKKTEGTRWGLLRDSGGPKPPPKGPATS